MVTQMDQGCLVSFQCRKPIGRYFKDFNGKRRFAVGSDLFFNYVSKSIAELLSLFPTLQVTTKGSELAVSVRGAFCSFFFFSTNINAPNTT